MDYNSDCVDDYVAVSASGQVQHAIAAGGPVEDDAIRRIMSGDQLTALAESAEAESTFQYAAAAPNGGPVHARDCHKVDRGRHRRVNAARPVPGAEAGSPRPRPALPAGLTEREVEVLRLAARELSNKEIGERLRISARTVGHHLAHIYDKTGRRTRAGASLFAMEHGLLPEDPVAR